MTYESEQPRATRLNVVATGGVLFEGMRSRAERAEAQVEALTEALKGAESVLARVADCPKLQCGQCKDKLQGGRRRARAALARLHEDTGEAT